MDLPIQFGPYVLLERLGEGAQGDVHLARLGDDPCPLVIKRLAPRLASNEKSVLRFRHEAAIATAVDCPHVVRVFDVGCVDDRLYFTMEHIAGWPLSRVITRLKKDNEKPPLEAVADIVCDALEGLHALHTAVGPDDTTLSVVHRDIAPKNLMLTEDGLTKVIDLGLGKSSQQDWLTATGVTMGTPGYMSPEQARGRGVDHRTDIFAMGVVLFELLTLERYLPGRDIAVLMQATLRSNYRPPSSIASIVPAALDSIVERAVDLDPARRFQSAREFAAAVRAVVPSGGDAAAELIRRLAWDDLAKTRSVVVELMTRRPPTEPTITKRIVFSERPIPKKPARPRRANVGFVGGLASGVIATAIVFSVLDRRETSPAPVAPPIHPRGAEAPRPIAAPRTPPEDPTPPPRSSTPVRRPPAEAPPAPRRIDPPTEVARPVSAPEPTESDQRAKLARMAGRAAELAEIGPAEVRAGATKVMREANRLASLASLDGRGSEIADCLKDLEAVERRARPAK